MATITQRALMVRLLVCCVLCLVLAGCKNKVTKENYDQITNDWTIADVQKLLGDGTVVSGDPALVAGQAGVALDAGKAPPVVMKWESGKKSITVTFKNGKVSNKVSEGL
jgi:hypothetical protein